jgi:hypothetical protein
MRKPAPVAPSTRPWYEPTLNTECATCRSSPGEPCKESQCERKKFHYARYELARARAGDPIQHPPDNKSAQGS